MRYTIEGFSQAEAVRFRRTETVNGKERTITLDCTDLVLLRWFVDFYPHMMKVEIDGRQYAWLNYKAAIEDMPLLGIKKGMLALRLKKMVDFGILSHRTVKNGGTFSYYGFGPEYMRLVDDHSQQDNDSQQDISEGVPNRLDTPTQRISEQIDSSTKYTSTKRKKERKKSAETYDSIIDGFTEDQGLRYVLRDFLRYRVASAHRSKKEFTNQALRLNLTKLSKLSNDPETMAAIVNQTIEKGWSGFFPLRDDAPGADRRKLYTDEQNKEFDAYAWDPDEITYMEA